MIQLSGMNLAREAMRQLVAMEMSTAQDIAPDQGRAIRLLGRKYLDVDEAVGLMTKAFRKQKRQPWIDAYSSLLLVMTDDEYGEFSILNAVFSRIVDRLADRMLTSAIHGAVDAEGDVSDEMSLIGAAVIETAGACLEQYRSRVGYRSSSAIGRSTWNTRHRLMLSPRAGIAEEHGAYLAADFSALERRVLEGWLAKRFPPLGLLYTFSSVASDLFDRYGRAESEDQMILAIESAEKIFDYALSEIDPSRQAGSR